MFMSESYCGSYLHFPQMLIKSSFVVIKVSKLLQFLDVFNIHLSCLVCH